MRFATDYSKQLHWRHTDYSQQWLWRRTLQKAHRSFLQNDLESTWSWCLIPVPGAVTGRAVLACPLTLLLACQGPGGQGNLISAQDVRCCWVFYKFLAEQVSSYIASSWSMLTWGYCLICNAEKYQQWCTVLAASPLHFRLWQQLKFGKIKIILD
jgi:hypothetical protein